MSEKNEKSVEFLFITDSELVIENPGPSRQACCFDYFSINEGRN
jgi:hypothetical protein